MDQFSLCFEENIQWSRTVFLVQSDIFTMAFKAPNNQAVSGILLSESRCSSKQRSLLRLCCPLSGKQSPPYPSAILSSGFIHMLLHQPRFPDALKEYLLFPPLSIIWVMEAHHEQPMELYLHSHCILTISSLTKLSWGPLCSSLGTNIYSLNTDDPQLHLQGFDLGFFNFMICIHAMM